MSPEPAVTIIIPAYNAARFLSQTLESVLAQTRRDWELIVIDDGSKDETVAIAEAFAAKDARIHVSVYPNGGVVVARNRGFAESKPEIPYIAYLDHDDLWEHDFLTTLLPLLEANLAAVGAHGIARFIDAEGIACEAFGEKIWPPERLAVTGNRVAPLENDKPTSFAAEAVINCIATPGQAVFRRRAIERAGLFRPDTNPCDDWDLYLRLTQAGDIAFVNKIVMGWRQHETNVSKDWTRIERMVLYVRRKLLEQPDLSAEHRQIALAGYRYTQRQAGQQWMKSARTCLAERKFPRAANHTRFAMQSYVRSIRGRPGDAA